MIGFIKMISTRTFSSQNQVGWDVYLDILKKAYRINKVNKEKAIRPAHILLDCEAELGVVVGTYIENRMRIWHNNIA